MTGCFRALSGWSANRNLDIYPAHRLAPNRSSNWSTLKASVVTWGCHVLASQNRYAAGSVQFPTRRVCLESCCTACLSGDNRCSCIVLSPQWQAPLHVGNVWRGQRSTAGITQCSFSLPLPLTDCHYHADCRLTGFTDDCASRSIPDTGRPNRLPRRRLLLSFEKHSTRPPHCIPAHLVLLTSFTFPFAFVIARSMGRERRHSGIAPVICISKAQKRFRDQHPKTAMGQGLKTSQTNICLGAA